MSDTIDKMKAFDIRPVKSLGQNFLTDYSIVERIVDSAEITKDDLVIEIGPGLGILTEELSNRAGLVVAVEIDKRLIDPLKTSFALKDNVIIINEDILKLNIEKEITEKYFTKSSFKTIKVVANLPYYITTPIIMSLLEMQIPNLDSMVFMVQKEVGERMTAKPGGKEYGAMTVCVKYFSECKISFTVPASAFVPRPNVDSCVVRMQIRKEAPFELKNRDFFFSIVKASFAQRRKMLTNSLANAPYIKTDKEEVAKALEKMGRKDTVRGEVLSPEEFATLSDLLYN